MQPPTTAPAASQPAWTTFSPNRYSCITLRTCARVICAPREQIRLPLEQTPFGKFQRIRRSTQHDNVPGLEHEVDARIGATNSAAAYRSHLGAERRELQFADGPAHRRGVVFDRNRVQALVHLVVELRWVICAVEVAAQQVVA